MRRAPLQIIAHRKVLAGAGLAYRVRGAALLVAIFAMLIVSSLVVLMLDVATTEMAVTRNTLSLSKALYVADAGIQHGLAMLRLDSGWRVGFPSPGVEFPPGSGSRYVVNVADGAEGECIITSTGTVGGLSKTLRATIAGVQ
ncbi:MAG: hypothetical protein JSV03_08600 [Planctomycetota bacterium]|nr:MAG: hypothetical protein JSV03_08600 [Planctomycetota bacterium]